MQTYFSGLFIYVMCTCMFLMFMMISRFPYEQPSELSSERSDQLTDQHSKLTF